MRSAGAAVRRWESRETSALNNKNFPEGFLWGAATAAYQIEGAVTEDGRTPSIWDTFSHAPGNTRHGDTGDIACDHYHRVEADLDLMASLGLKAYRFSPSWPRLQPGGTGALNPRAVDHYRRLLEGLHARSIKPVLTLYHWDLPQELQDAGGWPARDTAQRFAEYAGLVAGALGDLVPMWVTMNEPWVSSFVGHLEGRHAPGIRDEAAAVAASHHILLAHGLAVPAMRAAGAGDAEIGITLNLSNLEPASEAPADVAATAIVDGNENRWFLDALFRGAYPQDMLDHYAAVSDLAFVRDGDTELIAAAPVDFLGVNYYEHHLVTADPADARGAIKVPDGGPLTAGGIGVHPHGLRKILERLSREYTELPLYVTENGAAFHDYVDPEGGVDDEERVAFLHGHFAAVAEAIAAGVDVRGYFVWSLLDNFEWAEGYNLRFGIVYVDYRTQERIPKQSARWYQGVIAANGLGGRDEVEEVASAV
jgi:beta-glucosidase